VFPLDAELNLPPDKYSHGLCEVLVQEVVGGSFAEAVAHLERAGGGRMAKRQAEAVAVSLSQDFDAFYAQPLAAAQPNAEPGKLLVISADGKGIRASRSGPGRGGGPAPCRHPQAAQPERRPLPKRCAVIQTNSCTGWC
jgi:hypothetical protein